MDKPSDLLSDKEKESFGVSVLAALMDKCDEFKKKNENLESANSQLTEDVEHWKTCFEESMDSLNHTVAKADKLVKALEKIDDLGPRIVTQSYLVRYIVKDALKDYRAETKE